MNLRKVIATTITAFVVALVFCNFINLNVLAGVSDVVLDETSFAEGLNASAWNAPGDDIIVKDGKVIFPKNSTADTRIISKNAIDASIITSELFTMDVTAKVKNIPKGEKLIFAFSLESFEAYYEEPGNVEVVFENKNGIRVSVLGYDDSGEEIVMAKAQDCGVSLGSTIQFHADATTDMGLNIKVNNKNIYNKKSPIDLTGRVGILQSGGCEIEMTACNIVSHKYDTPENVNIEEDFEKGTINKNATTSTMLWSTGNYPCGVDVQEYDGSNVLMFKNVGAGYYGSIYQYSNFEMSFDIPYMNHESIVDEDGKLLAPATTGVMVAFGGDAADYADNGTGDAAKEVIVFGTTTISTTDTGHTVDISNLNLHKGDKEKGYSVKIQVIDTIVTVHVKSLTEKNYKEVLSYKYGNGTPQGYVSIWASGMGNFAIDNFRLINKDQNANVKEVEYQEAFVTGTEDWVYEPMEVVYLENENTTKEGFNWSMLMVYALIAGMAIIGVCIVTAVVKRNSKKGATVDEK